jgi:hypothetical protein
MNVTARPLDITVIILYLLGTAGVGVWFCQTQQHHERLFPGRQVVSRLGDRIVPAGDVDQLRHVSRVSGG